MRTKINFDEGYAFGLGAFETIAVRAGRPDFLGQHLSRLRASLDFLGIEQEVSEGQLLDYIAKEKLEEGAVKLMLSAENLIFSQRPIPYQPADYERGFELDFSPVFRNESSPFSFHKTLNYAENILLKRQAVAKGLDDFLFLNSKGEVCETTSSNIFFVKDAQLYTPALDSGLLPGIMRDWLCENAPVSEKKIPQSELKSFDEAFLTNSLMGIMSIRRIGDIAFPKREQADELRALLQAQKRRA